LIYPVLLTFPPIERLAIQFINKKNQVGKDALKPTPEIEIKDYTFQEILDNSILYEGFKKFCIEQWCLESLLFLKDLLLFT